MITGVTTDTLTRSVALDLERRGFVVFCAVPPASDGLIEQEGKHDLRALPLDIAEVHLVLIFNLFLVEYRCIPNGSICSRTTASSCWTDLELITALPYWSSRDNYARYLARDGPIFSPWTNLLDSIVLATGKIASFVH